MNASTVEVLVNPFAQNSDEPVEKRSQSVDPAVSETDPLITQALRIYDRIFDEAITDDDIIAENMKGIKPMVPVKIDECLQAIRSGYKRNRVEDEWTGQFITRLIKESFYNGNNSFTLTTGDNTIEDLPMDLLGLENESLMYQIIGQSFSPGLLEDCIAVYHGDIRGEGPFEYCERCEVTVHGDVEDCFAWEARNCRFTIYGRIGPEPAHKAYGCTFRTDRLEGFNNLVNFAAKEKGNIVHLLDDKQEVIREVRL